MCFTYACVLKFCGGWASTKCENRIQKKTNGIKEIKTTETKTVEFKTTKINKNVMKSKQITEIKTKDIILN